MKLPIHRLKKDKIVWLANHKCKHSHSFLEHYPCYLEEKPDESEVIGFLDIETSNLDANFGIMLTWCIKIGKKIYSDTLKKEDLRQEPDKRDTRIIKSCIEAMLKCDRIVGHYSGRFDIPFIRTRALMCGVEFPPYGSLVQDDTWQIARSKLKLNSNRLETVCRSLFGETEKTHIDFKYWIAGTGGDEKSLKYILDHNKKDVMDLERVYYKIIDYVRFKNSSI